MSENKIKINFISNCALLSFLKDGKSVADIRCKYDKTSLRWLEKFVMGIVQKHNYNSAKITFKQGIGATDIEGIIKCIQKAGIEIISMHNTVKENKK